ncbi:MAG TPA: glycosyltransferase [Solirubrobacterales bacterium]|nr:glycosyltransferase [Solirubrobacterales bacterium]
MRIGLVSKWIASGQAVVARQLRSALDELGHETFVLARPGSGPRAGRRGPADPVWDQPRVTEASAHEVPLTEYEDWARANGLEAILFDENYQWEEVGALRAAGIRTIGRFVWEYFAPEHVEPARSAYETIYSLTRCERDRYAELGIESPYVQWGIHPELLEARSEERGARSKPSPAERGRTASGTPAEAQPRGRGRDLSDPDPRQQAGQSGREAEHLAGGISREAEDSPGVIFYFPGSFLGRRKPIRKVVKGFGNARGEHLRLLIDAQVPRNDEALREAAADDPRIELMLEDEPEAAHRARFAACDVCLAPSRWEGLGLPLFEATGFGLPIITNDKPPMSEMVLDGRSGILLASVQNGTARSGIPAWDPDVDELTAAIERLGDRDELERMRAGVGELRAERAWSQTVADLAALIAA